MSYKQLFDLKIPFLARLQNVHTMQWNMRYQLWWPRMSLTHLTQREHIQTICALMFADPSRDQVCDSPSGTCIQTRVSLKECWLPVCQRQVERRLDLWRKKGAPLTQDCTHILTPCSDASIWADLTTVLVGCCRNRFFRAVRVVSGVSVMSGVSGVLSLVRSVTQLVQSDCTTEQVG